LQLVPEDQLCLALAAPVTLTDVVAVQPDLADLTVGEFGTTVGVSDHGPLAGDDLAAGDMGHRGGRVGVDPHRVARSQIVAVKVDHARLGVGRDAGHRQGCFGQTVGRLDGRR
jgi:hypothetical protein